MELIEKKQFDILELSGTGRGNVFIVLNGKLVTRDHRLNKPSEYNVI
jgi:hypothetical protein